MKRRRRLDLLGIHGLAIRSSDAASLEKALRTLLGLPVLRRTRAEVVLGHGPELFVAIRRAAPSRSEGIEEIHVAVKEVAPSRRRTREDALGGDSWTRAVGDGVTVTVREFRRPPTAAWRRKRPPV